MASIKSAFVFCFFLAAGGAGGAAEVDAAALSVVPDSDEEVTELTKAWVQAGASVVVGVVGFVLQMLRGWCRRLVAGGGGGGGGWVCILSFSASLFGLEIARHLKQHKGSK